jgi:hypothetical protein
MLVFCKRMQILKFASTSEMSLTLQTAFGVGLMEKLMIEFGISCVGIFLLGGAV